VETGFTCTTGTPNACAPICGNGIRTAPETCDDGNAAGTDGCSATCSVESGFTCTTASPNVCTSASTPLGGEDCGSAVTITANSTTNSTTTGMTSNYGFVNTAGCRGGSLASNTAPDSVFRTTIPAHTRLQVAATSTWDMTLNVISFPVTNCGTGTGTGIICLGGSDSVSGGTETVTFSNTTSAALDVLILIDGFFTTSLGAFSLTTSTQAIPVTVVYTKTSVTGACQGGSGTEITGPVADDATSAVTALPATFAFNYYGVPMTHFSMTSNGFAQLWPSSSGTPSTSPINATMPDTSPPNNLIAPFWDDLLAVTGTTAITQVAGTAPNRKFTLQWADYTLYVGTGGRLERLTFQAQLYETTNVIEYHYCTLAVNAGDAPRTSGGSATVGVENSTGTTATLHSFDRASSVTVATGLRFTP